jgi:hypothetical protein
MSAQRHTWLFEPGTWMAAGRFWQNGEQEREGRGSSIVRHTSAGWEIEGTLTILSEPPVEFRNTYEIPVPRAGSRIVPWRSHNPALGALTGVFFITDETIMSSFQSSDGRCVGSEHMAYLAPHRYHARGLFLAAGTVVSAWSMGLVRKA